MTRDAPSPSAAPVLAALGLGYCARRLVAGHPDRFSAVIGTARTPEKRAAIAPPAEAYLFDGTSLSADLAERLKAVDVLLVSAPPDGRGDPVLAVAADALAGGRLKQVIYLGTLGVYGNHDGAWVNEDTPPRAGSERLARRLVAESQWSEFGKTNGIPVALLRLAGIYGPGAGGRNPLDAVRSGEARRVAKPGQVFNRIHVDDIVSAILAVMDRRFDGIVNVTDNEPVPPGDPVAYGAELLGLPVPPELPFDEVAKTMSPMGLSFWASSVRVSNARLRDELGVTLRFPTYREGLTALTREG